MKGKTSRLILSMTFIFTLIISLCLSIQAYASEGNGNQGNTNQSANHRDNGIRTAQQGFLLYVADKETGYTMTPGNHVASDGNPLNATGGTSGIAISREGNPIDGLSGNCVLYVTKCDGAYPETWIQRDDAPQAVIWNGSTWTENGKAVMTWLMTKGTESGMYRYEYLLLQTYGQDFMDQLYEHADDWVVCVEYFHWNKVLVGGKSGYYTGDTVLGTNDGWAVFYKACAYPQATEDDKNNGNYVTRSYTHKVAMFSMTLDTSYWGVESHAGATARQLTYNDVRPNGSDSTGPQNDYGLQVITLESDNIHTYWESNGSPGDPEPATTTAKQGKCNIVKGYYTENETTGQRTSDGVFIEQQVTNNIVVGNEPEYEIVSWGVSTTYTPSVDPTAWNPPGTISQSGKTATTVKLDNSLNENTIYVLLKKTEKEEEPAPEPQDYNYKLTQSQITRRIYISKPDNELSNMSTNITTINFNFVDPAHNNCPSHTYYDGCDDTLNCSNSDEDHEHDSSCYTCGGHTATCNRSWSEQALSWSLRNTLYNSSDNQTILATGSSFKALEVETGNLTKRVLKETRTHTDESTHTSSNWDYVCVLVRGDDKLTVAKWVNNNESATEITSNVGLANTILSDATPTEFKVDNIVSSLNRKTADYKKSFNIYLDKDANYDDKTTMKFTSTSSYVSACGDSVKTLTLSNPLSINNIVVKVEVYSGDANIVADDSVNSSDMIKTSTSRYGSSHIQNNYSSGRMIATGEIKFNPYIRMQYDTITTTDLTAYVMGEYQRTIKTNAYAEIDWYKDPSRIDNLTIYSSMWSTHASSNKPAGTVLPGGASLSIKTVDTSKNKNSNRTLVARTYQTIIMDDHDSIISYGKRQIENTNGSYSGLDEATAISNHTEYVNSVVKGFEGISINQWVCTDENADWDEIFTTSSKSKLVTNGTDISYLKNSSSSSNSASEESKYYFKNTNGNSDSGNLDAKSGTTKTYYYTFRTDTEGNVYLTGQLLSGNSLVIDSSNSKTFDETLILTQNQDSSSLSGIALELNDKTYVVEHLINSIDRNSGNDANAYWVNNGHWYNEAFDGITVIVQETPIEVGLMTPTERWTVSDPKLNPIAKDSNGNITQNKGTVFTSYYSTAYKTDDYSSTYNTKEVIGKFKGIDVKLVNMEYLFTSKIFYITNITTQDNR